MKIKQNTAPTEFRGFFRYMYTKKVGRQNVRDHAWESINDHFYILLYIMNFPDIVFFEVKQALSRHCVNFLGFLYVVENDMI